jgi:hypothetical protein
MPKLLQWEIQWEIKKQNKFYRRINEPV